MVEKRIAQFLLGLISAAVFAIFIGAAIHQIFGLTRSAIRMIALVSAGSIVVVWIAFCVAVWIRKR